MDNVVKLIQKIVIDTLKASAPCDIRYATITSLSPLTITLQNVMLSVSYPSVQRLEITTEKKITVHWEDTIEGTTTEHNDDYIVRDGLAVGDKVACIRSYGGQTYLIIGKVA